MNKIRIGNDVRLLLTIKPNKESGFNTMDDLGQSNIKQVRCYMIKTEDYHTPDESKKDMYVRVRYPQFYPPTSRNINNAGYPSYFMLPMEIDHHGCFVCDFHRHRDLFGYRGFCLHPERFNKHDEVPKNWQFIESEVLPTKNEITCMFQAKDQHSCGTYKLVVIMTVFEQGWGKHNLRTYTIDKGNVLQLVDDESGQYGNITIDVDDSGIMENMIKNINVTCTNYKMYPNDKIFVGEVDIDRRLYQITVVLNDGTTVVYDPYMWKFNKLVFTSSNPDSLEIDTLGNIKTLEPSPTPVTVFIESSADSTVKTSFEVNIEYPYDGNTFKMGFSTNDDILDFQKDGEFVFDELGTYIVDNKAYNVSNDEDGKYLWIVSKKKIDVVTSSGFEVPMLYMVTVGDLYIYRTELAILEGDMQLKINYAL